jgi:hypothetical protein
MMNQLIKCLHYEDTLQEKLLRIDRLVVNTCLQNNFSSLMKHNTLVHLLLGLGTPCRNAKRKAYLNFHGIQESQST